MPAVIPISDRIHSFSTEADFEQWMTRHHADATEVWIRIQKKGSGIPGIRINEALDVALCWGWIDGIRKSLDAQTFLQRYSPRQKRSPWSLINTAHVARLINAERMQAPGYAQIAAAKADGRWDVAYSGSRDMKTPPELMAAIDANPKARAMYDTLTSQNRYALAFRLINLKTEAARARRVVEFVAMLARGETFYPNRKTAVSPAEAKVESVSSTQATKSAKVNTPKKTKQPAMNSVHKSAPPLAAPVRKTTPKSKAKHVPTRVAKTVTKTVTKPVKKKR